MSAKRIYTLCLNGFPGADHALRALSVTTGLTRHIRLAGTSLSGTEAQFVCEILRAERPRLVLFGGWSPVYDEIIARSSDSGATFGVYWTSSGGQTDISLEISKLAHILSHPSGLVLAFSARGAADALRNAGAAAHYLPITMEPFPERNAKPSLSSGPTRLSLFCPAPEYRRKNVTNTLLALGGVRGDWTLVLNGLSHDPAYATLLRTLHIPFQDLGWMPRPVYEETLDSIHLGLQLSLAESFDYVAAEHLIRGIPVVASPMVPVMDALDANTRAKLVVPAPDDVNVIRSYIQTLVSSPALGQELGQRAQTALHKANAENIQLASEVLEKLVTS